MYHYGTWDAPLISWGQDPYPIIHTNKRRRMMPSVKKSIHRRPLLPRARMAMEVILMPETASCDIRQEVAITM